MHVHLLNKRNWNSGLEWTRATQAHCWVYHTGDVTYFHSFNLILHPHFDALCRKYAQRDISSCRGERCWPATSTENRQWWDQIRRPHSERSTSFAAQMTSGQPTTEVFWVLTVHWISSSRLEHSRATITCRQTPIFSYWHRDGANSFIIWTAWQNCSHCETPTSQVCTVYNYYNYPNLVSSQHVEEVWLKKASGAVIHKLKFLFQVRCGNLFDGALHCQGDQIPSWSRLQQHQTYYELLL